MNNNHNNGSCDFSETLVSYLYGETGAAESDKFKTHLAHCAHCTEELAGFGAMRSSLVEWKQEEFAPMSAPVIELPVRDIPVILTDEPAPSWLDGIRAFLTPKIALTPIGLIGGFAAVLICLGLAFAFMASQDTPYNSGDKGLVAANNSPKEKTETASKTADAALPAQPNDTVNVARIDQPGASKKNEVKVIPEADEKATHEKAPKPVREYASYQPKNNVAVTNKHQDTPKIK